MIRSIRRDEDWERNAVPRGDLARTSRRTEPVKAPLQLGIDVQRYREKLGHPDCVEAAYAAHARRKYEELARAGHARQTRGRNALLKRLDRAIVRYYQTDQINPL